MLRNNSKRLSFAFVAIFKALTGLPARAQSQTAGCQRQADRKGAFIDAFRWMMNYTIFYEYFITDLWSEYKAPLNHLYNTGLAPTPEKDTAICSNPIAITPYFHPLGCIYAPEPFAICNPRMRITATSPCNSVTFNTFQKLWVHRQSHKTDQNNSFAAAFRNTNWQVRTGTAEKKPDWNRQSLFRQ